MPYILCLIQNVVCNSVILKRHQTALCLKNGCLQLWIVLFVCVLKSFPCDCISCSFISQTQAAEEMLQHCSASFSGRTERVSCSVSSDPACCSSFALFIFPVVCIIHVFLLYTYYFFITALLHFHTQTPCNPVCSVQTSH